MKKLLIILSIAILSAGCSLTEVSQGLSATNDTRVELTIENLCDPLSVPALQRKYASQPEMIEHINKICGR